MGKEAVAAFVTAFDIPGLEFVALKVALALTLTLTLALTPTLTVTIALTPTLAVTITLPVPPPLT